MTHDKEIIYVNGDSFTSGSDLADCLIPGYPEEQSLDQFCNEKKHTVGVLDYVNWRHRYFEITPNLGSLYETQRTNRWPTKLSNIIGRPVINKGHPGADNFSIFFRTCSDIEKLRSQGYVISKIIIQLTSFVRYSYVRNIKSSNEEIYKFDIQSADYLEFGDGFFLRHLMPLQMGSERVTEKENEFLKKSLYEEAIYDDQSPAEKLVGYLLTIKMYKDAVRGVAGIDPIIVDSLFIKAYLNYSATEQYILDKDTYIGKLFRNIFSDNLISMYDVPNFYEKSITAGGHFNSMVHEKFARILAEKYFNE